MCSLKMLSVEQRYRRKRPSNGVNVVRLQPCFRPSAYECYYVRNEQLRSNLNEFKQYITLCSCKHRQ